MKNKSETIGKLAEALSKAQGQIQNAAKAAENPAFKRGTKVSTYADLTAVWDACREHLASNGLAVVQTPSTSGAVVTVSTMLIHTSGEWIQGEMSATAQGPDAQKVGSATTYLRRYSLAAMVGVAPENDDDDANKASGIEAPAGRAHKPTIAEQRAQVNNPMARLEAVKAHALRTFGSGAKAKTQIEQTLGRTLGSHPVEAATPDKPWGLTDAEVGVLEAWVELNKAAQNSETAGAN